MTRQLSERKIVVKFGGSSLADHERMLKAVMAVVNEAKKGTKIAVVVSAMGKTTDVLMTTAKNTSNGKLAKHELGRHPLYGGTHKHTPIRRGTAQQRR